MIFLDASAMIAILARERDASMIAARLSHASKAYTSPIAVYEATLGLARIANAPLASARELLQKFLDEVQAEIVPVTLELADSAIEAFARFGKGRHAASLNMGDCFAYACARQLGVPLLYKGDDFPLIDIRAG